MQRSILFLVITALLSPAAVSFADQPVPVGHSTVRIVFLPSYEYPDPESRSDRLRLGMAGRESRSSASLALARRSRRRVASPLVSIRINDEFVGHAMPGSMDIKPAFILPGGIHEFTFARDGFKTTSMKLRVLETGSEQYLFVRLVPETTTPDQP